MGSQIFSSQFHPHRDATFRGNLTSALGGDVFPVRIWILVCYSFISAAGIVGNGLVLRVVSLNVSMRSSSFGTFLGSLAFADLLVAFSCLPVYITSTSWFSDHPTGAAGDVMCKILSGYNILFFFATVSVHTMVAISIERYYAICNPLSSRALATPSRAKKIIAGIWILSLAIGSLAIYGEQYAESFEASVGAHCKFSITYRDRIAPKIVYVVIFSFQYILPVCCMLYCFIQIRSTLTLRIREMENKQAALQPGETLQVKQRRQTIVTVVMVVVAYFALWTPNQVLYFCFNFQFLNLSWNSDGVQWSVVLCFFTCCVNPVIYSLRSKQFRHGFMSLFGWKGCASLRSRQGQKYHKFRAVGRCASPSAKRWKMCPI